ncbi:bifunctional diguanylate cyclase/phosphodiesterase [Glaciimonas sp. CA11.2]|uniref:putative bifunctional diguanylate cyclase/phosphodiesterase n=1 Tax=Glaciimonas sp. CA11.2 TaxID=3048601 RepID=UPI002AB35F53|nr:bifunctional diguanylate cyclase/phosphodiesterase [Glaciimonas sp. CA11.2]MDY7548197.1 bifunctional diguanylate cyclase/phosphodiesterase [Glaciimonas sp. CA11.2]
MTTPNELNERRLARADSARQQAELLLEEKSLQLYNEALKREVIVAALIESEERYRLLVELSPFSILIEVKKRIVFVNPAAQTLFCASSPGDLLGRSLVSLFASGYDTYNKSAAGHEDQACLLDGRLLDVSVSCIRYTYFGQPAVQINLQDISVQKELRKQLHHQATRDELTGLVNRKTMRHGLNDAITYAASNKQSIGVIFLDLDRFKSVNDSYGHHVGDLLLNEVAKRILKEVLSTDIVCRPSGDEFILVIHERADGTPLARVIQGIIDSIARHMIIEDKTLTITCSAGVAIYPFDGGSAELLLKSADIAMYNAKRLDQANFQFFTKAMEVKALERVVIEKALRTALVKDEFVLHYQLQVNAETKQIVGMEALIRWHHSKLGNIVPDRFIGIAEESGLIITVGDWVLRTACTQTRALSKLGFHQIRIAVNVSARQFSQIDFVDSIARTLKQTGLAPQYLELELTERLIMSDVELGIKKMHALKDLGITLSIDDFGTGYSSLSYLKQFPIDVLKIDRIFVQDISINADDAAIVRSIISLAHNLKLQVVAEGVETQEQANFLRAHGCDILQGYFICEPLPWDQLEILITKQRGCI